MSQYIPHGGFQWVEPTLDGIDKLTETSDTGRMYEVDIEYPESLHVEHNDLPFLSNNNIPPGSKVKKNRWLRRRRKRIYYSLQKFAAGDGKRSCH